MKIVKKTFASFTLLCIFGVILTNMAGPKASTKPAEPLRTPIEALSLQHQAQAAERDASFKLISTNAYGEATKFVSCMKYTSDNKPVNSVLVKWRAQFELKTDALSWKKYCVNRETTDLTAFAQENATPFQPVAYTGTSE